MTHIEHARRVGKIDGRGGVTCTASHITFGGLCLNCGYVPAKTKATMNTPPPITPLEFEEADFDKAEKLAAALGYEQTAYTSTSAMWGLWCLPENPARRSGQVTRGGCIIKTREFGLLFVQTTEDITGEVD